MFSEITQQRFENLVNYDKSKTVYRRRRLPQ